MIMVALAIGTGVFLFTFMDRQDVADEAVRGHMDLSRMRASELVTWSSAQCTADGRMEFLLHNYGEEAMPTKDIRMYGSWDGTTREFKPAAMSYVTLSNRSIAGDIPGGDTVWASIDMGCRAISNQTFSWACGNPLLEHPTAFSCRETAMSMVTPAEDVVRIDIDGLGDPAPYPITSAVSSCLPQGQGRTDTQVCFDTADQPHPLTGVEVWIVGRGGFPTATVANNLKANITGAGVYPGADAGTTCIDLPPAAYPGISRFRMVSDEGKSNMAQRPYMHIVQDSVVPSEWRCIVRNTPAVPDTVYCANGVEIPRDDYNAGVRSC